MQDTNWGWVQSVYSTAPADWARTLLGATSLGQGEPGSDGNEGLLCFPQSSNIIGTSPSDCLMSYLGSTLGVVQPLCTGAVLSFYCFKGIRLP